MPGLPNIIHAPVNPKAMEKLTIHITNNELILRAIMAMKSITTAAGSTIHPLTCYGIFATGAMSAPFDTLPRK